jgi:hypothetical protein
MIENLTFSYSTDSVETPAQRAKPNRRITFPDLQRIVTSRSFPASYLDLPDLARRAYRDGDKQAADLLRTLKKDLPYFLASGFCPVHHNNETLQYNGVLQIDVDFKTADGDQQAADLLARVRHLQPTGVLLATLSPSTFGVKILLATDNTDKDRHREALAAGVEYLAELLAIDRKKIDTLGASQPVYVPFERTPGQAYFNEQADVLRLEFKQQRNDATAAIQYDSDTVLQAAQFLIAHQISVADCYDEYLKITAACKNAFGDDGLQIATDLLNNSAAFRSSNFSKKIKAKFNGLRRSGGKQISGATIVWHAQKNGFTPDVVRNRTVLTARDGEYLTDVLDRHEIPLQDVCGKYIVSPTGSGKTTMVAEFARRYPQRRVILVLPLTATIRQFCADHPHAVKFTGGAQNRQISGDERLLVTTIQSFPALATRLDVRQFDVFFDEAHALTADASPAYKLRDLQKFLPAAKQAHTFTQMTGTPLYNFDPAQRDVERLEIRQRARIRKTAHWYNCDNILPKAVAMIRRSVEAGRLPFLLLNDKKLKLAEIETALQDVKLVRLNADRKDDPAFLAIATTGQIPADQQAIVTTTVLREGSSIYDARQVDFFIVGQHHSSTIQQITARCRTAQSVDVHLLKSKNRTPKDRSSFSPFRLAKLYERRAQQLCDEYNNRQPHDDEQALYYEHHLRAAIQTDPVLNDSDGRLQIDYLHLNNMVYQNETNAEHHDDRLQALNLRQYGFKIYGEHVEYYTGSMVLVRTVSAKHDPETAAAVKQARAQRKAEIKKAHHDALNALQNAISPAVVIRQAEQAGRVPAAYQWAKRLADKYGIGYADAIELLRDADTAKKYRLLENRICAERLRINKPYMNSGRLLAIQILALADRFRIGKQYQYTADDLRLALAEILALDKSVHIENWRPDPRDTDAVEKANRKAIALLRVFFDVERSGRIGNGRDGMRHRKLVFSLNKIAVFGDAKRSIFYSKQTESNIYSETELQTLETAVFTFNPDEITPF